MLRLGWYDVAHGVLAWALLAFGLSIALGLIASFLTREFIFGAFCAVVDFAIVVLGGEWYARTIEEKPSRKEGPEQQSNLGDDTAKSIEPQTARGGDAVRRAPERTDEALAEYEETTRLQPENPKAWHGKGIALFELRRHEEALQSFDKAIRLKPDDPETWYDRAFCLLELERSEEATVAFKKARRLRGRM
jgi:tetratricopeptide (TPR) repeat protein